MSYTSKQSMRKPSFRHNGSYFHRIATVSFQYTVKIPARYSVNLMICPDDAELTQLSYNTPPLSPIAATGASNDASIHSPLSSSRRPRRSLGNRETPNVTAFIRGKVTFKNPYGFLPAELFGLLPFQVTVDLTAFAVIDGDC